MHYDVLIIGAGMSGLAAGIRCAYFDKRVCILERHYAFGGLNSYYKLGGREFDVGLHAVTNYVPPEVRAAPLPKLLRQLRLTREDFDLRPQGYSEIRFPGRRLRFSNDVALLIDEVSREFPDDTDRFRRLIEMIRAHDDARLDHPYRSARATLADHLSEPMLIEMLLCPVMYYGSAEEHDMDFTAFVTLFKSILLEGFARPRGGVRTIVKALVRKFRGCGGTLRMSCGVERLLVEGNRVASVHLQSGEECAAETVLSSAGFLETMSLCSDAESCGPTAAKAGRLSFVETIAVSSETPAGLGHEATIVFFNDAERFTYARPDDPVDLRSGVFCCPNNYEGHEGLPEGQFRLTWLANYDRWANLDETAYTEAKRSYRPMFFERVEQFAPGLRDRTLFLDMFTPRTIRHYTGHRNGAVYGAPRKVRDGRTRLSNLFLCGTDQGYLGIVGAMLSGITMANQHVLSRD